MRGAFWVRAEAREQPTTPDSRADSSATVDDVQTMHPVGAALAGNDTHKHEFSPVGDSFILTRSPGCTGGM